MPDLPPLAVMAADLQRQTESHGPITIEIDPFTAFSVIGQVQLSSRHPENCGLGIERSIEFARALATRLPESAQAVIRAGWDPTNDVDVSE